MLKATVNKGGVPKSIASTFAHSVVQKVAPAHTARFAATRLPMTQSTSSLVPVVCACPSNASSKNIIVVGNGKIRKSDGGHQLQRHRVKMPVCPDRHAQGRQKTTICWSIHDHGKI